jgi:hypothetical protein
MSPEENKAALLMALRAFNDHQRREEYFRLYADEAVLHRAPPLAPGLGASRSGTGHCGGRSRMRRSRWGTSSRKGSLLRTTSG